MKIHPIKISDFVRDYRISQNISLEELSKKTFVPLKSLIEFEKAESDEAFLTSWEVRRIADCFDLDFKSFRNRIIVPKVLNFESHLTLDEIKNLYRASRITGGRARELLGITCWDELSEDFYYDSEEENEEQSKYFDSLIDRMQYHENWPE